MHPVKGKAASTLAVGTVLLNPNRAADPGLIYDTGTVNYVRLLCVMNYRKS